MLDPADRGIRGNSHMIMQDKNNLQIADLILQWIDERVSKRSGGRNDTRHDPVHDDARPVRLGDGGRSDRGHHARRLPHRTAGTGGELHRQRSCRGALRGARAFTRQWRVRRVRARRPHGVALASSRPDPDRHGRHGPRPALGWPHRGDSTGRRRQDPGRPEALARGFAPGVHDAHRDDRTPRRHESAVDGKGERRAVRRCAAEAGGHRHRRDPRVRCSKGSRPASRRSPTTCSSATSGSGPSCRPATAAS